MDEHLVVITLVDGKEVGRQPIEDPFLYTKAVTNFTWLGWFRLLWHNKVETVVKIQASNAAIRRWFRAEYPPPDPPGKVSIERPFKIGD